MSVLGGNVAAAFSLCNEQRERIKELEAQLTEAKAGWDSAIADLREAANICAEVEARLAACEWKPITETDLPKVGDEILAKSGHIIIFHENDYEHRDFAMWKGYTHFRAINPPQQRKP